MELKLSKETEFEGVKYVTLDIDLDSLTGKDLINAESEAYALLGRPATDLDKAYHACVAARAAKVPADLFYVIPARDFASIAREVQSFLLGI